MASPADAAAPGIGTVVQLGFAAADALNRLLGNGLTRAERQALEAARESGYRRERRGWISPDGTRVLERDVLRAGATILGGGVIAPPTIPGTAPTPAPPAPLPQPPPQPTPDIKRRPPPRQPRRYPGQRRQPIQPGAGRRPAPPPPEPVFRRPGPIINPNLPYYRPPTLTPALIRILGGAAGLFWPTPTASDDTVAGRPPGSQRGPLRRPRIRPRPPGQTFPEPAPVPSPLELPQGRPVSPPDARPAPAPFPFPQPVVIPSPVSLPAPAPIAPPRPTLSPWLALPFVIPALLPRAPSSVTNPLTQPGGAAPPVTPPPLTPVPTMGLPFSQPIPQLPSNDPCKQQRERERKKRKKRQPRNVCYRGTFRETSRSTLKSRKEKIPCQ